MGRLTVLHNVCEWTEKMKTMDDMEYVCQDTLWIQTPGLTLSILRNRGTSDKDRSMDLF